MELTKKQFEAVNSTAQSTLIIAGPGTGKTHIIASRVEFLVKKQKVNPENILCLTYTNAGAVAMKKRIVKFLDESGRKITVNTFHAFANSLIQEYPDIFGYNDNAQLASEVDQVLIIKKIIDTLYKKNELKKLITTTNLYFYKDTIKKNIDTLKSEGITPKQYQDIVEQWIQSFDSIPAEEKISTRGSRKGRLKIKYEDEEKLINKNKEFSIIYEKYEQHLQNNNQYDYSNMINSVVDGLSNNENTKEKIQDQYKSILVDEYQDTNGSQNKLLFHLLNRNNHQCFIVGDDDQAIHRFQGATIENFTDFLERFPKTKIISLEDNFRSPQEIIDSAFNFIQENSTRINNKIEIPPKQLIAKGKTANNKEYFIEQFETDIEEKAFIVNKILNLKNKKIPLSEIAILTRNNKEQEVIADYLYAHKIPYNISSTQNALKHGVVIGFLNILKCCQNPSNSEHLAQFLMHPASPITAEDTITVLAQRAKNKSSLYEEFKNIIPELKDKEKAKNTLDVIYNLYQEQATKTALEYIDIVAQKTGYISWILSSDNKIELLQNISAIYEETKRIQKINPRISIKQLIDHFESFYQLEISLSTEMQKITTQDSVNILTAHKSKGEEFDYVFIINNTQGVWAKDRKPSNHLKLHPSIKTQDTDKEDDRRLFFVALTRAKKSLFITYSSINTEGKIKNEEVIHSEFLESLTKKLPVKNQKIDNLEEFKEKIIISPPTTNYSAEIKNTIQKIIQDPHFNLSATAINNFLECPNKLLYVSILKIPGSFIPNQNTTYGNAIHYALQKYFETKKEKRSFDFIIKTVDQNLTQKSILKSIDNQFIIDRAKNSIKYYIKKLEKEPEPFYIEKNITTQYKNIPITGVVDKISKLQNDEIAIIDYKTSTKKTAPSINEILCKTKSTQDNVPKYYNQLMFYKILTLNDSDLKEYTSTKFILDFVDQTKEVEVPIDENDYKGFLQQIEEIWNSIQQLSFLESTEQFPFCKQCMYCQNIKK